MKGIALGLGIWIYYGRSYATSRPRTFEIVFLFLELGKILRCKRGRNLANFYNLFPSQILSTSRFHQAFAILLVTRGSGVGQRPLLLRTQEPRSPALSHNLAESGIRKVHLILLGPPHPPSQSSFVQRDLFLN